MDLGRDPPVLCLQTGYEPTGSGTTQQIVNKHVQHVVETMRLISPNRQEVKASQIFERSTRWEDAVYREEAQ